MISTRCELSVCATNVSGCCIVAAVTVSTTTCGAGRSTGASPLPQAAASARTAAAGTQAVFIP